MPSWRAISRLFDGWWPRRQASRLSHSCQSKTGALCLFFFFTSMLLFLHGVPSGWAAGNRHALSFQGLVKGLEAQMQRKYISIHLSVPIRPASSPFRSFLSVCWSAFSPFLKWSHSHPGVSTGTSEGRLCHPVELSALICRDLLLSCHLIIFFVRLLLSFFPLWPFRPLQIWPFQNLVSLGGSLRCMRGAVTTLLLFVPMSKRVTVYFPKGFIAIAWCFLSHHSKYTLGFEGKTCYLCIISIAAWFSRHTSSPKETTSRFWSNEFFVYPTPDLFQIDTYFFGIPAGACVPCFLFFFFLQCVYLKYVFICFPDSGKNWV